MDAQVLRRQQFLKARQVPLTIGFAAVADFSSYIGQEYLAGIMQATSDYGINVINMADAVRHTLLEDSYFLPQFLTKTQFMKAPLVDGLVTWASSLSEYLPSEKIQALFASLAPLPLVDIGYLDIPGVPSIRIDNSHAMHQVIQHLVEVHGFRRIAFIGTRYSKPHLQRLDYFKREMAAFGLPCGDEHIFLSDSLEAAAVAEAVAQWCALFLSGKDSAKAHDTMQAIVTSSDIIAAHAIEELEKRGIAVPDDVAVTGFNNQLVGITAAVPLTTIDLAYFDRGYKAVEFLIDRIMQPASVPNHLRVATSLVVRQTCRCFEHAVIDALKSTPRHKRPLSEHASLADIRAYLDRALAEHFSHEEKESRLSLVTALTEDIFNNNTPPPQLRTLRWFRTQRKKRHEAAVRSHRWEETISALRRTVLPLVANHPEQQLRLENICHALRTLYSVSLRYDMTAQQDGGHPTMTTFALSVTGATTLKQLENVLRFKLSQLGIPGIVLCASPYLSDELAPTSVEIVIPDPPPDAPEELPCKVREPKFFPKALLSHGKRFSATLEILAHNGKYIGYAYLLSGAESLALYDDVKELLSQTLYTLYVKEGRTRAHTLVVTDRTHLAKTIPLAPQETEPHGRVQTQDILDYMIDHLDEMLTLEKMADYFHLSKSHLARRIRALTGYSMQTLHERLKIEQAKDLIKSGSLKMNDISARLGFSNPNYFSNVFKKVTGLSPLKWAEKNHIEYPPPRHLGKGTTLTARHS